MFYTELFFDNILYINGYIWYTQLEMFQYMLEQNLLDLITLKQFSYCFLPKFQKLIDQ